MSVELFEKIKTVPVYNNTVVSLNVSLSFSLGKFSFDLFSVLYLI